MKWLTAALLALAVVFGGLLLYRQLAPATLQAGDSVGVPRPLPDVALLDDKGKPTSLKTSDGRLRLVFYGFVRCPDICPATLAGLKNIYAMLTPQQQARIQVQFISVDPNFDSPAVVRKYLNKFDTAFTGLTGTPENINEAAEKMFISIVNNLPQSTSHSEHTKATGNTVESVVEGVSISAPKAAVIHGDQISIIDSKGQFVRVYLNQSVIDGSFAKDLPILIKQYGL